MVKSTQLIKTFDAAKVPITLVDQLKLVSESFGVNLRDNLVVKSDCLHAVTNFVY